MKLLSLVLGIAVLATSSGLSAATTIKSSKSNSSDRVEADRPSPKVLTGKVTEVNGQSKSFTVMAKGKAVVFSAAKLGKLPAVGQTIDVTYTETPGGKMEASNLNLSKSNIN